MQRVRKPLSLIAGSAIPNQWTEFFVMSKPIFQAGPIRNKSHLAEVLDIDEVLLNKVLSLAPAKRYRKPAKDILKSDGSPRKIYNPISELRLIQRRINRRINRQCIKWPEFLFGSIPNSDKNGCRDYVACANMHCGSKSLLKMDISDFFDNIHRHHVKTIFTDLFRYNNDVSEILTELCCFDDRLVQGALTSSYLATLVLWDLESDVVAKLSRGRLTYTRLVDDITVSSPTHNFDFRGAQKLIEDMLVEKGLPTNSRKSKVHRMSTSSLTVHGLTISFKTPTYSKEEVRKIRAAVHQLQIRGTQLHETRSLSYRNDYYRVLGRVNKLSRVKHDKHERLVKILRAEDVRPRPSQFDKKSVLSRFNKIKKDHQNQKHYFQFYKRYNYLKNLLFFIRNEGGNEYKNFANKILSEVEAYEPTFIPRK